MADTTLSIQTVVYPKHKYACHVGIGKKRLTNGRLKDEQGVTKTMTNWLSRCVRDQPVVMGTAHVEVNRDFLTDRLVIRAWAYAFRDVHPDDRETLEHWVDRKDHQAIQIPGLEKWVPTL